MSIYLHDIPLPEAQARFKKVLEEARLWGVLGAESIPARRKRARTRDRRTCLGEDFLASLPCFGHGWIRGAGGRYQWGLAIPTRHPRNRSRGSVRGYGRSLADLGERCHSHREC